MEQNDANDVKASRRHFPGRCLSVWPTTRSHGMRDLWRELRTGQHRTAFALSVRSAGLSSSVYRAHSRGYNIIVQSNICV